MIEHRELYQLWHECLTLGQNYPTLCQWIRDNVPEHYLEEIRNRHPLDPVLFHPPKWFSRAKNLQEWPKLYQQVNPGKTWNLFALFQDVTRQTFEDTWQRILLWEKHWKDITPPPVKRGTESLADDLKRFNAGFTKRYTRQNGTPPTFDEVIDNYIEWLRTGSYIQEYFLIEKNYAYRYKPISTTTKQVGTLLKETKEEDKKKMGEAYMSISGFIILPVPKQGSSTTGIRQDLEAYKAKTADPRLSYKKLRQLYPPPNPRRTSQESKEEETLKREGKEMFDRARLLICNAEKGIFPSTSR